MNSINIGVGITFATQLNNGRTLPSIETFDVLVDIDGSDINIQLYGNLWTELATIFENVFKSNIVGAITDTTT